MCTKRTILRKRQSQKRVENIKAKIHKKESVKKGRRERMWKAEWRVFDDVRGVGRNGQCVGWMDGWMGVGERDREREKKKYVAVNGEVNELVANALKWKRERGGKYNALSSRIHTYMYGMLCRMKVLSVCWAQRSALFSFCEREREERE